MRYLAIHIIQSVPPANINRDDSGSPKSTMYGGVRRARVSSQAWKRATRMAFQQTLDPEKIGTRSKEVFELVAKEIDRQSGIDSSQIADNGPRLESMAKAVSVLGACGFTPAKAKAKKDGETDLEKLGYLMFLSGAQIRNLAQVAIAAEASGEDPKTYYKAAGVKSLAAQDHSVDIALFGRMVADAPDLNVDAACQVAHALGVHALQTEFDYFTAVDDEQQDDESGAGMIGTIEFNASTLYRYAVINLDLLEHNLGSAAATHEAVQAFVDAFITSMPSGKQNTFANGTLPSAALITTGVGHPANFAEAFEVPIEAKGEGYVRPAAAALASYAEEIFDAWGRPEQVFVAGLPSAESVLRLGERVPFSELGARSAEAAVPS